MGNRHASGGHAEGIGVAKREREKHAQIPPKNDRAKSQKGGRLSGPGGMSFGSSSSVLGGVCKKEEKNQAVSLTFAGEGRFEAKGGGDGPREGHAVKTFKYQSREEDTQKLH